MRFESTLTPACVPISWEDLMSATLKMRQYSPFLLQITAFLLNMIVFDRCFGFANLAKMIPAMTHLQ